MSNILFIGPFKQADGWGQAAREYIKALRTTGHNIQIRPVFFINKQVEELEFDIQELEFKTLDRFDAVIQNVLPQFFEYNKNYGVNIGLTAIETSKWENVWPRKIEMMDQVWVPSEYSSHCIKRSCRKDNVKIIPIPQEIERAQGNIKPLYSNSDILKDKFVFYFIGEYIERKNLDMLVKAFHIEFYRNEPVELLIKTNRLGTEPRDLAQILVNRFDNIKENLGLYSSTQDYKSELIITDRISNEEMNAIHKQCNCFVMPSSGEAWSIPAADSAVFGNYVIMTDTGASEFADILVESTLTNVDTKDKPLSGLFTAKELWLQPNFLSLRRAMRKAYNMYLEKIPPYKKNIEKLSYAKVGEQICQVL
jgi:glycosyltransferase involved in cell wall biosynthesis